MTVDLKHYRKAKELDLFFKGKNSFIRDMLNLHSYSHGQKNAIDKMYWRYIALNKDLEKGDQDEFKESSAT